MAAEWKVTKMEAQIGLSKLMVARESKTWRWMCVTGTRIQEGHVKTQRDAVTAAENAALGLATVRR